MGASDGATGATTEQGAPVSGLTEAAPDRDFGAALLDTAQTLICVLDREGCIVRFNRACEEATGFTSEEVVGRRAVDFVIPPEDADAFAAWLDEVWSSRAPNPQQGHWMTKSGGRRLIAWANRPLVDDDGAVRLLVTSGLDITERESAASELWSLQAQLHDRLEELSRLAAEQAALRRVATIVARERAPEEVFEAVTQEAGRLLGAESSALLAYSAITVAARSWVAGPRPTRAPSRSARSCRSRARTR
jgi:PAS domain S-box-containing protein